MPMYSIDYDLSKPGQNYTDLIETIQSFPDWAHVLKSSWVVKSPKTAMQVLETLLPHIDANDKIIVKQCTGVSAWIGLSDELSNWLKGTNAA